MVRYCSNCGAKIPDKAQFCSNCGVSSTPPAQPAQPAQPVQPVYTQHPTQMVYPKKHSGFGVAALVLGIIAVIMSAIIIFYFIGIILGILAIIFGAVGYWGKWKDKYGLAGFICGLVALILAIIWIIIGMLVVSTLF
jgi:hypothetical protein